MLQLNNDQRPAQAESALQRDSEFVAAVLSDNSEGGRTGLSSGQQWRMLFVLTLFAILSAIDKNFLTLVVTSIKRDIGLSDVQIGLILGLAFAASNISVSLPAGWLADQVNRRGLIASAVSLWSVMAAACGSANSFAMLFIARMGVGLGEGISPPPSYSLIRSGIPPERRGRAFGIFSIGAAVGSGLAFLLGGALLAMVAALEIDWMPFIGAVRPWQAALIIIGAVGLPLATLAFIFPDPGRGDESAVPVLSYRQTLALMLQRKRIMMPLALYSITLAMLTTGWASWSPSLIERTWELPPQQIGPVLGLMLLIGAPIGLIGSGAIMDRLSRNGAALAAGASAIVMILATGLAPHAPNINLFWVPQACIVLVSTVYLPVTSTLVSRVMPAAATGKAMAIFLLLQGAFGAGLGPVLSAVLADYLFPGDPMSLNHALTITAIILGTLSLSGAIALGLLNRNDEPTGERSRS